MSAMTTEQVREGSVDLFSGTWTCFEHAQTMKAGRECAFCIHDIAGEEGFAEWVRKQT